MIDIVHSIYSQSVHALALNAGSMDNDAGRYCTFKAVTIATTITPIFNIFISYIIKVQHFYTLHYILYKGKEKICEKQTSIKNRMKKIAQNIWQNACR